MVQSSALQEGLQRYEAGLPIDVMPYVLLFGIPIVVVIATSMILHFSHQEFWNRDGYDLIRAGHTRTSWSIGGIAFVAAIIGFIIYSGATNTPPYKQALEDSVMENYQVEEVTILEMSRDKTQEKFFPAKIVPAGSQTVVDVDIVHNVTEDYAMVLQHAEKVTVEPRAGSVAAQHVDETVGSDLLR